MCEIFVKLLILMFVIKIIEGNDSYVNKDVFPNEDSYPPTVEDSNPTSISSFIEHEKISEFYKLIQGLNSLEEITKAANLSTLPNQPGYIYGIERGSNAEQARPAQCNLQLKTVSLVDDLTDPKIYYHPRCTRVKRCDGCCTNLLHQCEPDTKTKVTRKFMVKAFSILESRELESFIVPVEEHTRCTCKCKVKTKTCSPNQEYSHQSCMCECRNKDEKLKCQSDRNKVWNGEDCSCTCRAEGKCGSNHRFNSTTCRCELINPSGVAGYLDPSVTFASSEPKRKHKDEPKD